MAATCSFDVLMQTESVRLTKMNGKKVIKHWKNEEFNIGMW